LLCSVHELFTNTLYITILHNSGRITWQSEMLGGALLSLPGGIVQRFMEYWLLLVLLMYMETHRQVREERTRVLQLQNELQTAELLALKKQLQPHFLYNTLNTVSALMDVDTKSARTVLSRLGQLLRITLDEERRETVPLIHEVDHVGNYLGIEAIRFKDRLQVRYDIASECQNALVPSMVLQPLVENSIKHGLDATNAEVHITIEALRNGDDIVLTVSDNGKGCPDVTQALARGGIGLRNVRERLSLLHGPKGRFQAISGQGNGFHVVISLPFETTERPRHEDNSDHRGRR
jgi:two-component system, LytTR family, sensor kinase